MGSVVGVSVATILTVEGTSQSVTRAVGTQNRLLLAIMVGAPASPVLSSVSDTTTLTWSLITKSVGGTSSIYFYESSLTKEQSMTVHVHFASTAYIGLALVEIAGSTGAWTSAEAIQGSGQTVRAPFVPGTTGFFFGSFISRSYATARPKGWTTHGLIQFFSTQVEGAIAYREATGLLQGPSWTLNNATHTWAAASVYVPILVTAKPRYIFEPPTVAINPPYLPDSGAEQVGLWRHYRPYRVGINVFLLNNGQYVQQYASPTLTSQTHIGAHLGQGPIGPWTAGTAQSDSNVPYPWNPYRPTDPYSTIFNWTGTVTYVTLTPRIKKVYYGGHRIPIDNEEFSSLVAAGYGTCITLTTTEVSA